MTFLVKGKKQTHRVVFKKRVKTASSSLSSSTSHLPERSLYGRQQTQHSGVVVEKIIGFEAHPSFSDTSFKMSAKTARASLTPDLYTTLPSIRDLLSTESLQIQENTIQECLPFLSGMEGGLRYNEHGVPSLDRERHITFLQKSLLPLPARFVGADASRPWMFYWALAGLQSMGEDVSEYKDKLIATVLPIQNVTGGFGGGNGQMSHLAPTYAIILALAIVGGDEALDLIDRKAMWKWLGSLKHPEGGFHMANGGEVDIRGAYIAAVLVSLLDLPSELSQDSPARSCGMKGLLEGVPEWIATCQTFEGGLSSRPDAEAHGAYAFCALACLSILGDPHVMIPKYLDVPCLTSWLSSRQYAPEGGFSGRTNKLVDGCYSHWVGVCWPLLEAALEGPSLPDPITGQLNPQSPVGSLYSREGLIRYILCCCQDTGKRGGLRDKPSHTSDGYHTCYVLSGLSSAQHKWHFNTTATKPAMEGDFVSPYQWSSEPYVESTQIYDEESRVGTLHPVFVIPEGKAEAARAHFSAKGGF